MDHKTRLLERLDEIAASLENSGHALALIGLGSVGVELERLDEYSDLDFFVIAADGQKRFFLDNLDWLRSIHPIAYIFQNTVDGCKLLFADGVLCEYAVFERSELETAVFPPGRVVWKRADVPEAIAIPVRPLEERPQREVEWLVGEALANLYVGLQRFRRGEKLSALRFIQGYAVDRLLELAERIETCQPGVMDAFNPERRFEQRYPQTARRLDEFAQGYARSLQSALAILEFLEGHAPVNPAMAAAVRELVRAALAETGMETK